MEEVIYKLKTLQSIEPDEAWRDSKKRKLMEKISVFGVRNDIFLSSSDIYTKKPAFDFRSFVPNRFAVSFASIALLLTSGVFTVNASQSSLPGDPLYSVKKVTEQVELAMASDQDKPKVEIEQAGKRLEELAQVSQKTSDSNQHEKVQQLVAEFQEKVDSANTHLSALSDQNTSDNTKKAQVAGVAKIVNEQSEKYTDVLQKTTDSLPDTVKEKVADKVADAAKTAEKVNLTALMVMVDNTDDQNKEEVVAKVQQTVAKAEAKVNEIASTTAPADQTPAASGDTKGSICSNDASDSKASTTDGTVKDNSTENVAITQEAMKELEKAKENLKNNNLIDTLKSVAAANDMADTVSTASSGTTGTSDATNAGNQPAADQSSNVQ